MIGKTKQQLIEEGLAHCPEMAESPNLEEWATAGMVQDLKTGLYMTWDEYECLRMERLNQAAADIPKVETAVKIEEGEPL